MVNATPRPLYLPPGKETGILCIGGWVGQQPIWTNTENLVPTGTVERLQRRYTDYAIVASAPQTAHSTAPHPIVPVATS